MTTAYTNTFHTKRTPRLSLQLGPFAPRLHIQIREQFPQIAMNAKTIAVLEDLADAFALLSIHVLNDTSKRQARQALARKVITFVKKELAKCQ